MIFDGDDKLHGQHGSLSVFDGDDKTETDRRPYLHATSLYWGLLGAILHRQSHTPGV